MLIILHYPFLYPAIVLTLVLSLLFSYLGFHVIRRGVIFVDLALAQMAGLGMSVALALGFCEDGNSAYLLSLAFTMLGALLFAFFRKGQHLLPIEALIGITYVGAITLSLLLLEKSAQGTEHVREMLMGTLFTTDWTKVRSIALIAALLATVHILFRKRFLSITDSPETAAANGQSILGWDLLFYVLFGLIVNGAVRVAGVLPVFAFLTIPASVAAFTGGSTLTRLVIGAMAGILGCIVGLEGAMRLDLAAGPSIIGTLLGLLFIAVLIALFRGKLTKRALHKDSGQ
ncbi:MAG: metal ABC transporter permease [Fibrobacteres bacterium]|nr:metal ABC transporter permease [Fibrobacterota bacterium]